MDWLSLVDLGRQKNLSNEEIASILRSSKTPEEAYQKIQATSPRVTFGKALGAIPGEFIKGVFSGIGQLAEGVGGLAELTHIPGVSDVGGWVAEKARKLQERTALSPEFAQSEDIWSLIPRVAHGLGSVGGLGGGAGAIGKAGTKLALKALSSGLPKLAKAIQYGTTPYAIFPATEAGVIYHEQPEEQKDVLKAIPAGVVTGGLFSIPIGGHLRGFVIDKFRPQTALRMALIGAGVEAPVFLGISGISRPLYQWAGVPVGESTFLDEIATALVGALFGAGAGYFHKPSIEKEPQAETIIKSDKGFGTSFAEVVKRFDRINEKIKEGKIDEEVSQFIIDFAKNYFKKEDIRPGSPEFNSVLGFLRNTGDDLRRYIVAGLREVPEGAIPRYPMLEEPEVIKPKGRKTSPPYSEWKPREELLKNVIEMGGEVASPEEMALRNLARTLGVPYEELIKRIESAYEKSKPEEVKVKVKPEEAEKEGPQVEVSLIDKLASPEYEKRAEEFFGAIDKVINGQEVRIKRKKTRVWMSPAEAEATINELLKIGDEDLAIYVLNDEKRAKEYIDALKGFRENLETHYYDVPEEERSRLTSSIDSLVSRLERALDAKIDFGTGRIVYEEPSKEAEFIPEKKPQEAELVRRWSEWEASFGDWYDKVVESVKNIPALEKNIPTDVEGIKELSGLIKKYGDVIKEAISSGDPSYLEKLNDLRNRIEGTRDIIKDAHKRYDELGIKELGITKEDLFNMDLALNRAISELDKYLGKKRVILKKKKEEVKVPLEEKQEVSPVKEEVVSTEEAKPASPVEEAQPASPVEEAQPASPVEEAKSPVKEAPSIKEEELKEEKFEATEGKKYSFDVEKQEPETTSEFIESYVSSKDEIEFRGEGPAVLEGTGIMYLASPIIDEYFERNKDSFELMYKAPDLSLVPHIVGVEKAEAGETGYSQWDPYASGEFKKGKSPILIDFVRAVDRLLNPLHDKLEKRANEVDKIFQESKIFEKIDLSQVKTLPINMLYKILEDRFSIKVKAKEMYLFKELKEKAFNLKDVLKRNDLNEIKKILKESDLFIDKFTKENWKELVDRVFIEGEKYELTKDSIYEKSFKVKNFIIRKVLDTSPELRNEFIKFYQEKKVSPLASLYLWILYKRPDEVKRMIDGQSHISYNEFMNVIETIWKENMDWTHLKQIILNDDTLLKERIYGKKVTNLVNTLPFFNSRFYGPQYAEVIFKPFIDELIGSKSVDEKVSFLLSKDENMDAYLTQKLSSIVGDRNFEDVKFGLYINPNQYVKDGIFIPLKPRDFLTVISFLNKVESSEKIILKHFRPIIQPYFEEAFENFKKDYKDYLKKVSGKKISDSDLWDYFIKGILKKERILEESEEGKKYVAGEKSFIFPGIDSSLNFTFYDINRNEPVPGLIDIRFTDLYTERSVSARTPLSYGYGYEASKFFKPVSENDFTVSDLKEFYKSVWNKMKLDTIQVYGTQDIINVLTSTFKYGSPKDFEKFLYISNGDLNFVHSMTTLGAVKYYLDWASRVGEIKAEDLPKYEKALDIFADIVREDILKGFKSSLIFSDAGLRSIAFGYYKNLKESFKNSGLSPAVYKDFLSKVYKAISEGSVDDIKELLRTFTTFNPSPEKVAIGSIELPESSAKFLNEMVKITRNVSKEYYRLFNLLDNLSNLDNFDTATLDTIQRFYKNSGIISISPISEGYEAIALDRKFLETLFPILTSRAEKEIPKFTKEARDKIYARLKEIEDRLALLNKQKRAGQISDEQYEASVDKLQKEKKKAELELRAIKLSMLDEFMQSQFMAGTGGEVYGGEIYYSTMRDYIKALIRNAFLREDIQKKYADLRDLILSETTGVKETKKEVKKVSGASLFGEGAEKQVEVEKPEEPVSYLSELEKQINAFILETSPSKSSQIRFIEYVGKNNIAEKVDPRLREFLSDVLNLQTSEDIKGFRSNFGLLFTDYNPVFSYFVDGKYRNATGGRLHYLFVDKNIADNLRNFLQEALRFPDNIDVEKFRNILKDALNKHDELAKKNFIIEKNTSIFKLWYNEGVRKAISTMTERFEKELETAEDKEVFSSAIDLLERIKKEAFRETKTGQLSVGRIIPEEGQRYPSYVVKSIYSFMPSDYELKVLKELVETTKGSEIATGLKNFQQNVTNLLRVEQVNKAQAESFFDAVKEQLSDLTREIAYQDILNHEGPLTPEEIFAQKEEFINQKLGIETRFKELTNRIFKSPYEDREALINTLSKDGGLGAVISDVFTRAFGKEFVDRFVRVGTFNSVRDLQDFLFNLTGRAEFLQSEITGFVANAYNKLTHFVGLVIDGNLAENYRTIGHELMHLFMRTIGRMPEFENDFKILNEKFKGDNEALAEAFGHYLEKKYLPPSPIKRIFDFIKSVLEKVSNYFRGLGWKSSDDVFSDILAGKFANGEISIKDVPFYEMNTIEGMVDGKLYNLEFRRKYQDVENKLSEGLGYISNYINRMREFRQFAKEYAPYTSFWRKLGNIFMTPAFNRVLAPFYNLYKEAQTTVLQIIGAPQAKAFQAMKELYEGILKDQPEKVKFINEDLVFHLMELDDIDKINPNYIREYATGKGIHLTDSELSQIVDMLKLDHYAKTNVYVQQLYSVFQQLYSAIAIEANNLFKRKVIDGETRGKLFEIFDEVYHNYTPEIFRTEPIRDSAHAYELLQKRTQIWNEIKSKMNEVKDLLGIEEKVDPVTGKKNMNFPHIAIETFYKSFEKKTNNIEKFIGELHDAEKGYYLPKSRRGGNYEVEIFVRVVDKKGKAQYVPIYYWDTNREFTDKKQAGEFFEHQKKIEEYLKSKGFNSYKTINTQEWHNTDLSRTDFVAKKMQELGTDVLVLMGRKPPRTEAVLNKLSPAEAFELIDLLMKKGQFDSRIDTEKLSEALDDAVYRMYAEGSYGMARVLEAKKLPENLRSALQQVYIDGYLRNYRDITTEYFSRMQGYLVNRRYAFLSSEFMKNSEVQAFLAQNPDARDIIAKYNEMLVAPSTDLARFVYKLRALGAFYFIAGRISTALMNTFNILFFVAPEWMTIRKILEKSDNPIDELMKRYVPIEGYESPSSVSLGMKPENFLTYGEVIKDIGGIAKDKITTYIKNGWIDKDLSKVNLEKVEAEASNKDKFILSTIQYLLDRGSIESAYYQMLREEGLNLFGKTARRFMDIAFIPFRFTENYSRLTSAIMLAEKFFDAYEKKGLKDKITDFNSYKNMTASIISGVIEKTFFDYTRANRYFWTNPSNSFGAIMTLATTLKGFTANVFSYLADAVGKKEYARIFYALLPMFILGGLAGLPFIDDIADVFERMAMSLGIIKTPIRMQVYNKLKEFAGEGFANFVVKGVPYALGLVDMSNQIKVEAPIPKKLSVDGIADALFGIYGGIGDRWEKALKAFQDREVLAGMTYLLPLGISMPIQAYLMTEEPAKTKYGRPIIQAETGEQFTLTTEEAFFRALGFRPARLAEFQDTRFFGIRTKQALDEWRRNIYTRYRNALLRGADTSDIVKEIDEFNELVGRLGGQASGIAPISSRGLRQALTPALERYDRLVSNL